MSGLTRISAAAAIVVGLLGLGAVPAFATHVTCGEVITQDTKLDNDLINCPPDEELGAAIVIGADDVTLDLNRHTIGGGGDPLHSRGIENTGGYDRLTVKNGTVEGFAYPLLISGADNVVTNVNVEGRAGVRANVTFGFQITRSVINGGAIGGIGVRGSGPFRIEGNVVTEGIRVESADSQTNVVIRRNEVVRSGDGGYCAICLYVDGSGAVVEHNYATAGLEVGIYATGGLIRHNLVEHNRVDGIQAGGAAVVSHNTANYNGNLGIEADPTVIDGGGNRAKGNGNPLQCVNVFCK
jgi:hypothetical protein